ncbi:MAG: selenocysteine-specific translation elongation factor [Peptococcaceae bacterium]|nr:selenocysteine-specific translation elongation factor [Peptococcaceae bacterium]
MRSLIIGTAGHVDHGKTELIRALTGIDTDRLQAEKERGISIELGFAYLDLPGGQRAGIIDVPGHERFIKNMLAGVGGIDLVLLVIAADEGVMPQTREHLHIIQLLGITRGIVVITKADLVDDEWLELVKDDVRDFLKGTNLANAPVVVVSSVTRQGIDKLMDTIVEVAQDVEERKISGPARLPIDRKFSVTGFGSVVTGTLISGVFKKGDAVEILPAGLHSRIRSMQVHGSEVQQARAGQRVAINLAGIDLDDLHRGDVVAPPHIFKPSNRMDLRLSLLSDARPLKHRARVRFYIGAAELLGRIVLLDRNELKPGDDALTQIILEGQTVAAKGDRFVIRSYSPMQTIGGGQVIEPNAQRHKRFREEVLQALETLEKGRPEDLVVQFLNQSQSPATIEEIVSNVGLSREETAATVETLAQKKRLKALRSDEVWFWMTTDTFLRWRNMVLDAVKKYHQKFPLREGYPKEELRSRYFNKINGKVWHVFLETLQSDGDIDITGQAVTLSNMPRNLPPAYGNMIETVIEEFKIGGTQPPSWKEVYLKHGLGESEAAEIMNYLVRQGELIKLTDNVLIHREEVEKAKEKLGQYLEEHGSITVGEARNLLATTRKYALPLLEYFDQVRFTKRVGDERVLWGSSKVT